MVFFRMHRHFMDPVTNVTCDVALVVQDIGDLMRPLKAVVENTYLMTKLKSLGMEHRYRVDIFQRVKMRKPYRSLQRSYKPEIFALYRSYSQGGGGSGKEVGLDGRNNIFKGAIFRIVLPLAVVLAVVAFVFVYRFFNPAPKAKPVAGPVSGVPAAPGAPPPAARPGTPPAGAPGESPWRVIGAYTFDGNRYVTITRGKAVRTLINPRGFYFDALRAYGTLDGEQLTNYTGQADASLLSPGTPK